MADRRYLYLHGFRSNRDSDKGVRLGRRLAGEGIELERLDLNVPDFERMTYSSMLEHVSEVAAERDGELFLIGSSMGGYLAARWAELFPQRVLGLFLLCPGFDLAARWPELIGAEGYARWERDGVIEDDEGRRLRWQFVLDSRKHSAYPEIDVPIRIVHGRSDETVPIEYSRRY